MKYSEKSQEVVFPNQLDVSILVPQLPYNWHLSEKQFTIDTTVEQIHARTYLLKEQEEGQIFIGYPINAFKSPKDAECLCPVMLFPVELSVIEGRNKSGLVLTIDRKGISLNQDWVEYHVPECDKKAFLTVYQSKIDKDGEVDVDAVLTYIRNRFSECSCNPNVCSYSIKRKKRREELLNTAVLFVGNKTTYTRTMLRELKQIADTPDTILDQTALAYVFREPPLQNVPTTGQKKKIPVSFTENAMNRGQFEAVEECLNQPLTKVQGPPGTGKTFMSVNLIANEVFNGGRVLFTSKNHKAIHAIYDKVPDWLDVAFCTDPENSNAADWQKSQDKLDLKIDLLKEKSKILPGRVEKLESATDRYRDAEQILFKEQMLRDRLTIFEYWAAKIEQSLPNIILQKDNATEIEHLLREVEEMEEKQKATNLFSVFFAWLMRLLRQKPTSADTADAGLRTLLPSFASPFISLRTIRKEAKRLRKILKWRHRLHEWIDTEQEIIRKSHSDVDSRKIRAVVEIALRDAKETAKEAYIEYLRHRYKSLYFTDNLVAECKKYMLNMPKPSQFGTGKEFHAPSACFIEYLTMFPAWAVTMLSLRRASPCLPGVFSLAIVDEASQCEIPPLIPVLFRAKRVALVGDPAQFPPVITLKSQRDLFFQKRYNANEPEPERFCFCKSNAFRVAPGRALLLNEHFRCADGIAGYFNETFYKGRLMLCCETGRRGNDSWLSPGMIWQNASGGDANEIEEAFKFLCEMKQNNYTGSIGIISPFRALADQCKTCIANHKSEMPDGLEIENINTANGFQGGECDTILFLLGWNKDRTHGEEWYITAEENRYIFNVSVSRAKHTFVTFGDRIKVEMCKQSYIRRLIPQPRNYSAKVGPGELLLAEALTKAGI